MNLKLLPFTVDMLSIELAWKTLVVNNAFSFFVILLFCLTNLKLTTRHFFYMNSNLEKILKHVNNKDDQLQ